LPRASTWTQGSTAWQCQTTWGKKFIAVLKSSFLTWFHVISRYLTWFNTF
jgi:hypothetical protein